MEIAQVDYGNIENAIGLKFAGGNLGSIISELTQNYILTIAGIILLLYLIYGGFQFLTSGGDPKKAQEAQSKITQALIGFVIVFAAYWIVQILANVLGLKEIRNIFGPGFNTIRDDLIP